MQKLKFYSLIIFCISPAVFFSGCVSAPLSDNIPSGRVSSTGRMNFKSTSIKKIVIDAGHGGNDPGAIGKTGLREKDVNLDIAKKLARVLKDSGIEVVLTRSSDNFIPLDRRVEISNNARADLFVSIHSNANRARLMNGFEVYYITPAASVDSRRALSAAQGGIAELGSESLFGSSLDLRATLWDMINNSNRADSIELAQAICHSIRQNLDTHVIGVKSANYYVLRGARMPAVLIEIGFVSNLQEERMLRNANYRQQVAEAIERGIENYARNFAFAEVNN
ncbi:MAG: N-acetylmuramoyl-L-alanine amidase [Candidatus Omnitrophica bacterium]|nr:N-acetylmuramoyl-L-alanine amidase [Candidatus Omnitrophota bacterium]